MLKDQSSLDRRVSPNNNLTQQLYEQFLVFKDYLDSSRKNKKQTTKTKRQYQQQQQSQQNRKNSQQQQNRNKSEGEQNRNNSEGKQNPNQSQQKYLKQHKNQDNMIMNTPQPSKKWRKFNAKNQSNSCQDQSQQQILSNSPQLASGQKNQWSQNHPIPNQQYHTKSNQNKAFNININLNLNMNQSTKRSQLIAEYTELYEYSIKKVIENNNRRIKKKRKHNQDSQQQHNVKNIASNLQNDFNQEDNDFNKGDNDFNKEDNGSNQEDNDFNKGDKNKQKTFRNGVKNKDNNEIARRLIFNYQDPNQTNFKDIYQKDNQHLIQQNTIDRTQTLVQDLLASFQTRISKVISFHGQRLKKIDRNLSKLRLFIHDNNFGRQAKSKEKEKEEEKEKEKDNYFQTQQKQLTVFKWKDNVMKNESQQNKINKQMQNVQALQFNQFNEEYVPDDTSSLYSQNTQGRDLLFDQRA